MTTSVTTNLTTDAGATIGLLTAALILSPADLNTFTSLDPLPVLVRATCAGCGARVRTFDVNSRLFGCLGCEYTSDERGA